MNLLESVLNLLGVAANEVSALTKGTAVGGAAALSADLLSAINATLRAHAANVGKPIDQVIAEL